MHPVLFQVGDVVVRSYSVILVLAIFIGLAYGYLRWHSAGLSTDLFISICTVCVILGLIGARLYLSVCATLASGDAMALVRTGGLASAGGIIGFLAGVFAYCAWRRCSALPLLDVLAEPALLVEAIMRWGCLLNGCCYGKETTSWLALPLPDIYGHTAERYPTQILLSLNAMVVLLILRWLKKRVRRLPAGGPFVVYMLLYSTGRILIDGLRGDSPAVAGPFSDVQLSSLALIVATLALVGLYWLRNTIARSRLATVRHKGGMADRADHPQKFGGPIV